ncbi:hypothetical protein K469DRAFT_688728 [Zopfia rhizophila CBS 207.26]|uniref:Uncharacterized protein n=1 Tax=Zopfia rhizophila CBS 207.26 TaxID=1314779 RepID=A0A6A6E2U7_9PEZI|nr:hypothetical protein K469DRAFT_688728 [Zopfia rhizophila CBS 207.26]
MAAASSFPEDLPPRTQAASSGASWKDRNCPNMRSCWDISLQSYSLHTSDKAILSRHICMILILLVRLCLSILSVVGNAWGSAIVSFVLGSILAVLGFLFIAWCLAKIGEAQGHRRVLGMRVGRWQFDIFLLICAVIHVLMLVGYFFGFTGVKLSSTWTLMWLIIFTAAWVATWVPECPESNV